MTATPLKLTLEMKEMIANAIPDNVMVFAAVSVDGKPLVTFRGSTSAYSDDQLSVWLRHAGGSTEQAIERHPEVVLLYRSKTVPALQFNGRARVTTDPMERNRAYEISNPLEQKQDPERKGTAVIIDLDLVQGVIGFGPDGPIRCHMERGD
jgi:hypothetical protein